MGIVNTTLDATLDDLLNTTIAEVVESSAAPSLPTPQQCSLSSLLPLPTLHSPPLLPSPSPSSPPPAVGLNTQDDSWVRLPPSSSPPLLPPGLPVSMREKAERPAPRRRRRRR